jgi:hypothetical protein
MSHVITYYFCAFAIPMKGQDAPWAGPRQLMRVASLTVWTVDQRRATSVTKQYTCSYYSVVQYWQDGLRFNDWFTASHAVTWSFIHPILNLIFWMDWQLLLLDGIFWRLARLRKMTYGSLTSSTARLWPFAECFYWIIKQVLRRFVWQSTTLNLFMMFIVR